MLLLLSTWVAAPPGTADPAWRGLEGLPASNLRVEGTPGELADDLRSGLALGGQKRWFGGEHPLFFVETLEQDLARTRLFLARNGYPDATAAPEVQASSNGKSVAIVIHVTLGDPVTIRDVHLQGVPPDLTPPDLSIHSGRVFRDAVVQSATDEMVRFLRSRGHALAEVSVDPEVVDGGRVDLLLTASAGPRFRYGDVLVTGVQPNLVGLVRATLGVRTGDTFSPERLRDAETALRALDLFRLVRVDVQPRDGDRLDVVCDLSERLPRSFGSGIGYFGDDQLQADAEWRHRNLLGGGRGVAVGGRASRFLQRLRADVVLPRLGGTPLRAVVGAAIRRENEDAYELLDGRADFTLSSRVGRNSLASAGVALAYVDLLVRTEDPALDDPVGFVTTVPLTLTRDTSNHPIYPSRGVVLRGELEFTPPGLGSVTEYGRAEARATTYRSLGSTVLASRVAAGVARPLGDTQSVLASRRMFSGGSRSMRGFGRRRLGPQDADNEPLGGEAKLEASAEYRFPLFKRLEAALFVDAGQVWSDRAAVRLEDLRWATGPALMVRSPVGPLRVDWGILLGTRGEEPRNVFHFSVGHPY